MSFSLKTALKSGKSSRVAVKLVTKDCSGLTMPSGLGKFHTAPLLRSVYDRRVSVLRAVVLTSNGFHSCSQRSNVDGAQSPVPEQEQIDRPT